MYALQAVKAPTFAKVFQAARGSNLQCTPVLSCLARSWPVTGTRIRLASSKHDESASSSDSSWSESESAGSDGSDSNWFEKSGSDSSAASGSESSSVSSQSEWTSDCDSTHSDDDAGSDYGPSTEYDTSDTDYGIDGVEVGEFTSGTEERDPDVAYLTEPEIVSEWEDETEPETRGKALAVAVSRVSSGLGSGAGPVKMHALFTAAATSCGIGLFGLPWGVQTTSLLGRSRHPRLGTNLSLLSRGFAIRQGPYIGQEHLPNKLSLADLVLTDLEASSDSEASSGSEASAYLESELDASDDTHDDGGYLASSDDSDYALPPMPDDGEIRNAEGYALAPDGTPLMQVTEEVVSDSDDVLDALEKPAAIFKIKEQRAAAKAKAKAAGKEYDPFKHPYPEGYETDEDIETDLENMDPVRLQEEVLRHMSLGMIKPPSGRQLEDYMAKLRKNHPDLKVDLDLPDGRRVNTLEDLSE